MDIAQIAQSLESIQEAFGAFSGLVANLEEAGLPEASGSFSTRLANGVLHDAEFLGRHHQLMCEFEQGIEAPRVSFRLKRREGPENTSVTGEYDLKARRWTAHVNAPAGNMPPWLEPFAAIVKSANGTSAESRALAYNQLIHAIVPLLSWQGLVHGSAQSAKGESVRA